MGMCHSDTAIYKCFLVRYYVSLWHISIWGVSQVHGNVSRWHGYIYRRSLPYDLSCQRGLCINFNLIKYIYRLFPVKYLNVSQGVVDVSLGFIICAPVTQLNVSRNGWHTVNPTVCHRYMTMCHSDTAIYRCFPVSNAIPGAHVNLKINITLYKKSFYHFSMQQICGPQKSHFSSWPQNVWGRCWKLTDTWRDEVVIDRYYRVKIRNSLPKHWISLLKRIVEYHLFEFPTISLIIPYICSLMSVSLYYVLK